MVQTVLVLIWKGDVERSTACQDLPQVIGKDDKPPFVLPVTHLVGKLWHIFS